MRVLLISPDMPPVLNSAARLFNELAQDLSETGHRVTVITRIPERYLAKENRRDRFKFITRQDTNAIRIWRIRNLPGPRSVPLARILEQMWMAMSILLVGLLIRRQQALIVYSPPLPVSVAAYVLARLRHSILIVNVQDLYPQAAIDLGLIKTRLLVKTSMLMESFVYSKADLVSVHSKGNMHHVIRNGGTKGRVRVIPNWVDVRPFESASSQNSWRENHELEGSFIISFAGTMGYFQGLEQVLESACQLKTEESIVFVLSGDGVSRGSLEKTVKANKLDNVRFLPHQPDDEYVKLLLCSNICLVSLDRNLTTPVVPGKLQSIMASSRPVIFCGNSASDGRRIIEEAECGYFVSNSDPNTLTQSILNLYRDPELAINMGRRGHKYAKENFQRESCTNIYHEILCELKGKSEI